MKRSMPIVLLVIILCFLITGCGMGSDENSNTGSTTSNDITSTAPNTSTSDTSTSNKSLSNSSTSHMNTTKTVPKTSASKATGTTSSAEINTTTSNTKAADGGSKEDNRPKISVILMSGQSNMEGHSYWGYLANTDIWPVIQKGFSDILIADYDTSVNFHPVLIGRSGNNSTRFGPEQGVAMTLSKNGYGNKVVLIKYAVGGTGLVYNKNNQNTWAPLIDGQSSGNLYKNLVTFTNSALKKLAEDNPNYRVSVDAMFWMQGENDSTIPVNAAQYEKYEDALVKSLRQEFAAYGSDDMYFFDAYISTYWQTAGAGYTVINSAKQKVASKDARHIIIDTISARLTYDKEPAGNIDYAHYDSMSMIKLGQLFAEAYMKQFPLAK